ncbi:MAG: hypothetical protein BWX80_04112 [Candidatus Hydrogenedentes bacterium ADurb.Bin101]|nr:MAG: hypothetical protein BWX80_04112 [Candidatus Hydrogenedentes bacterium ADurb.Bin101]
MSGRIRLEIAEGTGIPEIFPPFGRIILGQNQHDGVHVNVVAVVFRKHAGLVIDGQIAFPWQRRGIRPGFRRQFRNAPGFRQGSIAPAFRIPGTIDR